MKASIKQLDISSEFHTPEGCYIIELSNTPEDPDVSIAQARVPAGVTTRWHRLKGTDERYCIIKGKGRMEVGDHPPQEVNPGDVVIIPQMCCQRITNIGSGDLIFLAICTPRFSANNYEDIKR